MDRRDILRKCGAAGAAGGLGLLAGCSGGSEGPGDSSESDESDSLEVTDFEYGEGDSGELVITLTVTNSGDSEESGTLYVTVTAAATTSETEDGNGSETDDEVVASRESRDVTVPGGEETTVEIPFAFTVEQFERQGNLEIDLRS